MKFFATLSLLVLALPVFGQTSPIVVQPLQATLAFSINLPNPKQSFPPDFQEHVIEGTTTNLTDSTIYLQYHRTQTLATDWVSSVCFGTLCLAPTADSARLLFKFGPHETEAISLHFNDTSSTHTYTNDTTWMTLVVQKVPGLATDTLMLHITHIIDTSLLQSGVRSPNIAIAGQSIVRIYPNPATRNTEMTAQISTPQGGSATVAIYDLQGQKLREVKLGERLSAGVNVLRFESAGLSSGSYMLAVSIDGQPEITNIFKVVR